MAERKTDVSFAESPDFVVSLARGLQIIKAFGQAPSEPEQIPNLRPSDALTVSEVAEKTGLARAVVRRFLYTLVELGYVITDGKYFRLTARILDLGYAYLASFPLPKIAERFLEQVTLETKESSSASVLEGFDIVYVARVQTRRIMSISLSVGSRLPAFCTSMGRVLLAQLPEQMLERYLQSATFSKFTERTVCNADELRKEIRSVSKQGYALVDQELELGLRSLAVPVLAGRSRTVAAVNVSTQAARTTKAAMLQNFLPVLRQAAADISSCLGRI
ncbi:MAG: helix-turn-helix domain-containing protein [Verrucomicrobia bacterium]|nr:helix-turn-helix domain-containing protein [Verrucomicrobiota bacterium]MBV8640096.1 helix-turn-helix domain-containing protein [Verrucomicrobiota bacterium]